MIRLSDYIFKTLADWGVRHVFMVTGGGAMFLNDSIGRENRIKYICNHHEQACAIAAEGYARVSGQPGVICVTSGPGGTNAITGVLGAWTDSIPMLVLSGQVKRATCVATYPESALRQLGDQEIHIIRIVTSITKYACFVEDPLLIRFHLERAYHLATTGRPGPCWLDIPLDVQASMIEESELQAYDPSEDDRGYEFDRLPGYCTEIISRLHSSERPVILAGSGVRQAGTVGEFEAVVDRLQVPVVLSRTSGDLLPSDHPLRCGRAGIDTERAANFVIQNADLLLILGCRLGVRQVGYNWADFAPHAFKYQVDADRAELCKPTIRPDVRIHCELKAFLSGLAAQLEGSSLPSSKHLPWLSWSRERVRRYPGVLPHHRQTGVSLNPYRFLELLFARLAPDDVIVCGNGAAFVMTLQAAAIQRGQRVFFNSGTAAMGYDLPAAIGAAFGRRLGHVVLIAGEGSIQMNLQELQTIVHHGLPVKMFVLSNGGYLSIRTTQLGFFGNLYGESPATGVSFPDLKKVADAFGLSSFHIRDDQCGAQVEEILSQPGPVLVDVVVDPNQEFEPRSASRRMPDGSIVTPPLEDMYPFLEREELAENVWPGSNSHEFR